MKAKREVRTLHLGEEKRHLDILNLCFGNWGDEEKWKKMYVQPGFKVTENVIVVEDDGKWAGGGTCWFRDAFFKNDKEAKMYVAGDLYVHPEHRGKGVYSTAMQSLNEIARKRAAFVGIAFPSISAIPSAALPKYGFHEIFRPSTWIYVFNPEKFLRYLFSEVEKMYVPEKYEGLKLKLQVSFALPQGKHLVTRMFRIAQGRLHELTDEPTEERKFDLTIKTNIETLMRIYSDFYLKKRTLTPSLIWALLTRRVTARFSLSLLKTILRPK
jgi:GNAT superfamily N-acetyltransferase